MSGDPTFNDFRRRLRAGVEAFVTGDPVPYQDVWSRAEDVSIFGGWGAYERGWDQVGPRLAWAASRYGGGAVHVERIAEHVAAGLACLIDLEHYDARLDGAPERREFALRVTHICRREADGWRIVHRHADFMRPREEAAGGRQA